MCTLDVVTALVCNYCLELSDTGRSGNIFAQSVGLIIVNNFLDVGFDTFYAKVTKYVDAAVGLVILTYLEQGVVLTFHHVTLVW